MTTFDYAGKLTFVQSSCSWG